METNSKPHLQIRSDAFQNGEKIPSRFTCDGEDINPALEISDLPEGTETLALIVEDPDAPNGTYTHWLIWDIPPSGSINEDDAPGTQGKNDFGNSNYGGPCPPSGTHRYYFRVFALNKVLGLPTGSSKEDLLKAIEPNTLASGELMGTYSK